MEKKWRTSNVSLHRARIYHAPHNHSDSQWKGMIGLFLLPRVRLTDLQQGEGLLFGRGGGCNCAVDRSWHLATECTILRKLMKLLLLFRKHLLMHLITMLFQCCSRFVCLFSFFQLSSGVLNFSSCSIWKKYPLSHIFFKWKGSLFSDCVGTNNLIRVRTSCLPFVVLSVGTQMCVSSSPAGFSLTAKNTFRE